MMGREEGAGPFHPVLILDSFFWGNLDPSNDISVAAPSLPEARNHSAVVLEKGGIPLSEVYALVHPLSLFCCGGHHLRFAFHFPPFQLSVAQRIKAHIGLQKAFNPLHFSSPFHLMIWDCFTNINYEAA